MNTKTSTQTNLHLAMFRPADLWFSFPEKHVCTMVESVTDGPWEGSLILRTECECGALTVMVSQ